MTFSSPGICINQRNDEYGVFDCQRRKVRGTKCYGEINAFIE